MALSSAFSLAFTFFKNISECQVGSGTRSRSPVEFQTLWGSSFFLSTLFGLLSSVSHNHHHSTSHLQAVSNNKLSLNQPRTSDIFGVPLFLLLLHTQILVREDQSMFHIKKRNTFFPNCLFGYVVIRRTSMCKNCLYGFCFVLNVCHSDIAKG